jgi:hypothetical protein
VDVNQPSWQLTVSWKIWTCDVLLPNTLSACRTTDTYLRQKS